MTARTLPRWVVFAPLAPVMVASVAHILDGIQCPPTGVCEKIVGGIEWAGVLFPQLLAFWLALAAPRGWGEPSWVYAGLTVVVDAIALALAWRFSPPRFSGAQALGVWAAWLALSGLSLWVTPDVMNLIFHLR